MIDEVKMPFFRCLDRHSKQHKKAVYLKYLNKLSLEARKRTMLKWPSGLTQKGEEMAKAGFFYDQTIDHATCFYCGLILSNWLPGECPWTEHIRWNEKCNFITMSKTDKFIDEIKGKLNSTEKIVIHKTDEQCSNMLIK